MDISDEPHVLRWWIIMRVSLLSSYGWTKISHKCIHRYIYIDDISRNLFFRNSVAEYINNKVFLCILFFLFSSVKLNDGLDHARSYMDKLKTDGIDHSRRFMHMFMFMLNDNIKNNSQFYQHFPHVFLYISNRKKIDGNWLSSK